MKITIFFLVVIMVVSSAISCKKDPPEAMLPDNVEFGESVVFLNGEEVDYLLDFQQDTFHNLIGYTFGESKNQGQLINNLTFSWLPIREGEFELTTERIPLVNAVTSFHQYVSEDLEGYEYKLMDADEGFFNVEYLDTINMEVKGRFKAKFCRTKKNGTDGELPKNIVFQGVFYENYFFK